MRTKKFSLSKLTSLYLYRNLFNWVKYTFLRNLEKLKHNEITITRYSDFPPARLSLKKLKAGYVSVFACHVSHCLELSLYLLNEWRLSKGTDETEESNYNPFQSGLLFPDALGSFTIRPNTWGFCLVSRILLFSVCSHLRPVS